MAKFKVGDKVWVKSIQKRGVIHGASLTGDQYDVLYMGGKGGYHNEDEIEPLSKIGSVNARACNSTNSVVRKAMNASVAKNATFDGSRKVKVVAETDTLFGKKRETKVMTLAELYANMTAAGHERIFNDIVRDLETKQEANPFIKLPCEAWFSWA